MTAEPKFVPPGSGPVLDVLGIDRMTCKIVDGDTAGQIFVFETVTRTGAGASPRVHYCEEETF